MLSVIKINENDNVAVAVNKISKGEIINISGTEIKAEDDIPAGHKIAIYDIENGKDIIKYGFPIGISKNDIKKGQWVHTHNIKTKLDKILNYDYKPNFKEPINNKKEYKFMGYKRDNGSVGIRNEVWIIPTVGCVNAIADQIARNSQKFKTDNIDGIFSYSHPYGCSQLGDDQLHTQKILSGLIKSPNAGAVLVIGLGCENNQISLLKEVIGSYDEERVKFLVCQESENEIEDGVNIIEQLCAYASKFHREECDISNLVIGLKCGGSDGFSGITANPLVGEISNIIVSHGGTSILTEVPEMFGAETLLMARCRNEEVFKKTADLINNFKSYFIKYGENIDENPSPGNKEGGISTLEDKSLGCVQKGGNAVIEDVLLYGDTVSKKGLMLLQSPGNDLIASNALAAAGSHIILFTTGRGTPFSSPVPTIKISSNSNLAKHKKNWIDFDAGILLTGETMESTADKLIQYILDIASGNIHAKSESLNKQEIAIFKDGVTL